jgi:hypothetical protein
MIISNDNGHRTFDDVEQGVTFVACIDDGAFGGIAPAMALGKKIIEMFGLLLNRLDDSSHNARRASSESGSAYLFISPLFPCRFGFLLMCPATYNKKAGCGQLC